MKTYEIVGYAYDAACHCVKCTALTFAMEESDDSNDWIDSEGNPVHPIFAGDEGVDDECCDDCGGELV